MTLDPIEHRLSDSGDGTDPRALAGHALRALGAPPALSERAHQRILAALRAAGQGTPRAHVRGLRPAVIVAMLVFTAAASATRKWWLPPAPANEPTPIVVPVAPEPAHEAPPRKPVQQLPAPAEEPAPSETQAPAPPRGVENVETIEPAPPVLVRPKLLSNPQVGPKRPVVPSALARLGASFSTLLEICVSASGGVTRVSVLNSEHPPLDQRIVEHVKTWKYEPARADGVAVPLCFPLRYRLSVDQAQRAAQK